MSSLLALGLLVAGFCPAVLCHPAGTLDQEDQKNATHTDDHRLASSNTDFTFSLYKQLTLTNPNANVIFSPLSVSTALAFLSLGARSTTLMEILHGLKFNLTEITEAEIHQGFQHLLHTLSQPNAELHLNLGNAMFFREDLGLLAKFIEDAERFYAAQVFTTNFQNPAAAEMEINNYVKEKTQGKIVDLITGLNARTVMVLINYILFKAKWKTPFDPRDTFKSKFFLGGKKRVEVPMMSMEDVNLPYFWDEENSCAVLELQYTGNASALFILPNRGKMEEVEAALGPETLRRWTDSLQLKQIDELYLPKFRISSEYKLESTLPRLGIKEVFSRKADLSGATVAKNLEVSQVVHKAVLDVAEVGTEAAASTGVKIMYTSAKLGPKTIVNFNRPFLVAIVHKDTKIILFLGKVANPKQD